MDIGHKIIYAAQIDRTLKRLGGNLTLPALRSLVLALLHEAPGKTEAWQRSQKLLDSFPQNWEQGRGGPADSLDLLRKIRNASSSEAQQIVLDGLHKGLGAQTIWDGLRLFASELFNRHIKTETMDDSAILLPVHAVTMTNAFAYAYRQTKVERTKKLMLLQAAGWLPLMRSDLQKLESRLPLDGPGLDLLGQNTSGRVSSLEQCFEAYSADAARLVLDQKPDLAPTFRQKIYQALLRKGVEHHQHKYVAAICEESVLAHPKLSAMLLAPSVTYLNENEADTALFKQSDQMLAKLL